MKRVAIIGGGISGLSCAYQLSKKGVEFKLFERNQETGGRIKRFIAGEMPMSLGAFAFSMNYHNVLELIYEMGFGDKITAGTFGKLGIYTNGRLIKVNPVSIIFDRSVSLRTKFDLIRLRRLLFRITPALLDDPVFDMPLDRFILNRYSKGVLKDFVEPSVASYFADSSKNVSAKYGLRALSASFNTRELSGTLYPLVEALTSRLGGRISLGTRVSEISPHGNSVRVQTDKTAEEFDYVICCLPVPELEAIGTEIILPKVEYEARNAYIVKGRSRYPDVASIVNGDKEYHVDHIFYRGSYSSVSTVQENPNLEPFFETGVELIYHHRWSYCAPRTKPGETIRKFGTQFPNIFTCGDYVFGGGLESSVRAGKEVARLVIERAELATA
ncbi:MAG: FAD-dependent oxidoreductase [Nitrososphaerota archaeon]|nr:FAD-dependent oxidoreductase [Nitrososphaerota archaeon]